MYLHSAGTSAIVRHLNDHDVPTFATAEYWKLSNIHHIMTSASVCGTLVLANGPPKRDYYPRIISDAMFEQARLLRMKRSWKSPGKGAGVRGVNLFAGLGHCAVCGAHAIVFNGTLRSYSLRCVRAFSNGGCLEPMFVHSWAEKSLLDELRETDIPPTQAAVNSRRTQAVAQLSGELAQRRVERDRLVHLALTRKISKSRSAEIEEVNREIVRLRADIRTSTQAHALAKRPDAVTDAQRLCVLLADKNLQPQERRDVRLALKALLGRVFERIEFDYSRSVVTYTYGCGRRSERTTPHPPIGFQPGHTGFRGASRKN